MGRPPFEEQIQPRPAASPQWPTESPSGSLLLQAVARSSAYAGVCSPPNPATSPTLTSPLSDERTETPRYFLILLCLSCTQTLICLGRLQVETDPIPHLVLDVRTPEAAAQSPLPKELSLTSLHLPAEQVESALAGAKPRFSTPSRPLRLTRREERPELLQAERAAGRQGCVRRLRLPAETTCSCSWGTARTDRPPPPPLPAPAVSSARRC